MRHIQTTIICLLGFWALTSTAGDVGFRWNDAANNCYDPQGHPGRNPDFFGECGFFLQPTYKGRSFDKQMLSGSTWTLAFAEDFKISNSIMHGFGFTHAYLNRSVFTNCELQKAVFNGTYMMQANFEGSDLTDAKFIGANVWGGGFKNSTLSRTDFSGADLSAVSFQGSTFYKTNFQGAKLFSTNFEGTNLSTVDLRGARYNKRTRLPFDQQEAARRQMILIEE